ncbi:hypothetical protein ACIO52_22075 [Nocardia sp. NPDC087230]|uniref:hypothetical protein n=1 Tax=Nocardia sp. NPDC087230 TaxID=3364331 RepID=UPI0038148BCC
MAKEDLTFCRIDEPLCGMVATVEDDRLTGAEFMISAAIFLVSVGVGLDWVDSVPKNGGRRPPSARSSLMESLPT